MNYIKIGDMNIYNSNSFSPAREDVYAGEYTNCNGETVADLTGWKYSDMTLSWDSLSQDQLEVILAASGAFELTFTDPLDGVVTESVMRTSAVLSRTRITRSGVVLWKDVQFAVRFLNVHAIS